MTCRKSLGAYWLFRKYERGNLTNVSKPFGPLRIRRVALDPPTPFASAGALAKQIEHSFEEHGMSCRKYSSRTIFCTFPLLVDLTKTLLEMFELYGSASERLRLVMVCCYVDYLDT